jgi:hypothetical protein
VYTLIFSGAMGMLWLAWVGLNWWMLLREKRRPLELTALGEEDPRTKNKYVMTIGRQAEQAGFRRIGTFVDSDPKWRQGVFSVLLQPDGRTLLRIHHSAMIQRIVLTSAMTSDVWVANASSITDPDATGLSEEEVVYANLELEPVLARHTARIAEREAEIIPWSPEEIASDLMARDRRRIGKLVSAGRARVRDAMTGQWSFTLAGAKTQRELSKKFFRETMEQAKADVEEKKRAKKLARQAG